MQIKDFPNITTLADNDLLFIQTASDNAFKNIKASDLKVSLGGASAPVTPLKLIGTPFGASPPYAVGHEFTNVFDGDSSTYYDYYSPNDGYCGIDLGFDNTKKLVKVRVYPRQDSGVQYRSGGAIIQGSNTSQTSGFTDLFTLPATPNTGIWYEGNISTSTAYRYLRYLAAPGTYCSVSEVEFYGN